MKCFLFISVLFLFFSNCFSQQIYEISAPKNEKKIYTDHLKMGGTNSLGKSISVNSYYILIDGKPVIPVLGEFHYCRYPHEQWEEEIMKMKAGGITVIPTYVFWNIHEEQEGVFDWTGDRNIRKFIQLCKKHGMSVIVRIGPFGHGEIRNGGLPDWLFSKPLDIRSNDVNYLNYVRRLYKEIARQLDGLYFKDGGPIIGTQIENEHQHSAAPWGVCYPGEPFDYTSATYDADITMVGVGIQNKKITTAELGNLHMKTLKQMAEEEGIITPFYTATGWGNAAVIGNEAIPVTAAYTYPFWDEPSMSPFCLFKDIHKNPDYAPVRYDADKFPSFCAEMGAGMQMIYKRRPIVTDKAAEALMIRTLGSGANGIGYYMYHGGSTPKMIGGVGSFNDEPMGMPKISYDYQAPLGEFGLEHDSYRTLRLLHTFLADFGDLLAPMETVLPDNYKEITPDNKETLRYAVRMKDDSGFIFMVNYQDHDIDRIDIENLKLKLNLKGEKLNIPYNGTFTLPKDESLILPFNFSMSGALLKYSTAQLLMKLDDEGVDHYFFFAPDGIIPEYCFDGNTIKGKTLYTPEVGLGSTFNVRTRTGVKIKITTLTREEALNSCKVEGKLLLTESRVLPSKGSVELLNLNNSNFEYIIYPSKEGFKKQILKVPDVKPKYSFKKVGSRRLTVNFEEEDIPHVKEYYLHLDYIGDVGMAFLDNTMVLDHFYFGKPWIIGLKRFSEQLKSQDMNFYFRPLRENSSFLIDLPENAIPDFSKGSVCKINKVEILPEYVVRVNL